MSIFVTWMFRSILIYTVFEVFRIKKRVSVLERTVRGIVAIIKKLTRSVGWLVKKVTGK